MSWQKYRKSQYTEMRPVTEREELQGRHFIEREDISISPADTKNGSPKVGDMIARNPNNHGDKWLVSEEYFTNNYELMEE